MLAYKYWQTKLPNIIHWLGNKIAAFWKIDLIGNLDFGDSSLMNCEMKYMKDIIDVKTISKISFTILFKKFGKIILE